MHDEPMRDEDARRELKAELDAHHIHIHQPDDPPLFTRVPQSPMQPVHWKAADLKVLLRKIGEGLSIDSGGNRRTLRLANPGLPFGTTPTFWCSIQYILPGEVAGAHRHQANAMRFIMEGTGARSTVNGEDYPFGESDLVLTPNWTWHDHTHEGSEPMVWLDVLDISLVRSLHATFFELFPDQVQPRRAVPQQSYLEYGSGLMSPVHPAGYGRTNPLLVYPYSEAGAALERAAGLEADAWDDTVLEYRNPAGGGAITDTLGARLLRIRPGFRGAPRRHTGSKVYYVVRGSGRSTVGGNVFDWGTGDFLSIPPWALHAHEVSETDDPAVLFEVNDLPAIKKLGFYREDFTGN